MDLNFEMPDLDKLMGINKKEQKLKLQPDFPFRAIAIGGSNSGKTHLITRLLLPGKNGSFFPYDKLYICANGTLDQPKYNYLRDTLKPMELEISKRLGKPYKIFHGFNDVEGAMGIMEAIDNKYRNLVIFDDWITSPTVVKKAGELFVRGRHKAYNCSVIFLTQIFYELVRDIRLNANIYMIFKDLPDYQLTGLARGIPSRGLTNKEMSSLIRYVTRPTHDNPNPCLYIDISQIDPRLVYRDGPTECIIIPKLLKQTDDVLRIGDSSDEEDEKEKNVREEVMNAAKEKKVVKGKAIELPGKEEKKVISPVTDPIRVDAASSSVSADNKEDEEKRVSLKDKLREKLRIKLKE